MLYLLILYLPFLYFFAYNQLLADVLNVQEATNWKRDCHSKSKYRSLRCHITEVARSNSQYGDVMTTIGSEALKLVIFCLFFYICLLHFHSNNYFKSMRILFFFTRFHQIYHCIVPSRCAFQFFPQLAPKLLFAVGWRWETVPCLRTQRHNRLAKGRKTCNSLDTQFRFAFSFDQNYSNFTFYTYVLPKVLAWIFLLWPFLIVSLLCVPHLISPCFVVKQMSKLGDFFLL